MREQAAPEEPAAGDGCEPVAGEPGHAAPGPTNPVAGPVPEPHAVRLPVRCPAGRRGRGQAVAGGKYSPQPGGRVLRLRQAGRHRG